MRYPSGQIASVALISLASFCCRPVVAQSPADSPPALAFSTITSATLLPNGLELRNGAMTMRIIALRDDVLRIRASRVGDLPEDASWAVLPAARSASVPVTQESNQATVGFHTASVRVAINRSSGLMSLKDLNGNILQADSQPLRFEGRRFYLSKAMPPDEHYFGLGDKTGAFDHRDAAFRMWNTDAYAWQESTDPLYKDIPFYLSYRAGLSVGVLIDNTWPCSFDFGKISDGQFQYQAEDGPVDVYLLAGPSAKHVLSSYAWLTGPTPLPPLWALGYQQSRYSYPSQSRVLEVADRLRSDKIPADAIYLDIDYQVKNRPFTIDTQAFPDMAGMIKQLHKNSFHVVAITDLHIADLPGQGYAPYDSGAAGDHFVKNPGGTIFVGPVWPGPSVFPDFTRHATREWWGSLYTNFVHLGLDGFWNDMDEPSVFTTLKTIPNDVVHRIDEPGFTSRTATHREIHNLYGMQNSRATFDGILKLEPTLRPFVLTRASYAGGQRYAATWTGDDSATWNHLRLTTSMLKNLGLSGFSLAGADVGGYAGTPSSELLTKWLEIAAFQPIDRDHAEKGTGDHEPWANGPEQEAIRRHFIETRYKLLPYLYTVMEEGTRTGLPLLRPVFLEFPDATPDRHPLDIDVDAAGEFMVGPDLLVGPAPFPEKLDDYNVKLPSFGWYDFWTGNRTGSAQAKVLAAGLQPESGAGPSLPAVHIRPDLATLPVFVRPGAILPVAPLVQSTDEKPRGPLTLRVFPGPDCAGSLYQDDGKTFVYQSGAFLRMSFSCTIDPGIAVNADPRDAGLTIHISPHTGGFPAWWNQLSIEVNGLSAKPKSVTVDGQPVKTTTASGPLVISAEDSGKGLEISIR